MNLVDARTTHASALADRAGLALVAAGAWPDDPASGTQAPPPVAGFVGSSFSPLVVAVAERCLEAVRTPRPVGGSTAAPPALGDERTAVVIVSGSGDAMTAAAVAAAVDRDERIGPLLFFASVPNAVAGYVAARWGPTGPVVCLSPPQDALAEGLAAAALLIRDGDADGALVVHVEQALTGVEQDCAVAVLVRAAATASTASTDPFRHGPTIGGTSP